MTDLLLKPEDTGEIPTGPQFDPDNPGTHAWDCDCELEQHDPGPDTRNLSGYAAGLPPVRRPEAVLALAGYTATLDGELVPDGHEPPEGPRPRPTPSGPPGPPPPVHGSEDLPAPLSVADADAWAAEWRPETPPRGWFGRLLYRGAHRRSGR